MEAEAHSEPRVPGHEFFALARSKLDSEVPAALTDPDAPLARGDHDLEPAMKAIADMRPIRPAAVLIPVVDRPEPTVLLTLRTENLSSHAGQIAFPGGRIDPEDVSPQAAALREAQEEIGLDPCFVEPLGYLDVYLSGTGYRIVPTVARVRPGFQLAINPAEVAETFEVPLAFVMGPENHQRHSREWRGMMRSYYAMPFGDRYIWGVTAGILRNLYERLYL
ncbi:MAG TPA: CoA pyrophosphatase [Xanthobacteraceae bacterium]|nr:CoA pyrophosphatase [Xanthobacteraceae bacterium]